MSMEETWPSRAVQVTSVSWMLRVSSTVESLPRYIWPVFSSAVTIRPWASCRSLIGTPIVLDIVYISRKRAKCERVQRETKVLAHPGPNVTVSWAFDM